MDSIHSWMDLDAHERRIFGEIVKILDAGAENDYDDILSYMSEDQVLNMGVSDFDEPEELMEDLVEQWTFLDLDGTENVGDVVGLIHSEENRNRGG